VSKEVSKSDALPPGLVGLRSVRSLKKLIKFIFVYPLTLIDYIFASRKSQVISVSGHQELKDDLPLVIYVHYSSQNIVSEREKLTLLALQRIGFQTCLVINVNKKGPSINYSLENNRQFFDALCLRKNIGYDLGAYRDILVFLKNQKKTQGKRIYFMNNSVIWFPEMIESYFKELQSVEADVVAATISNQYIGHLQTYLFGANTESGLRAIQKWLSSIKNWRLKRTIVARGELSTNSILISNLQVAAHPSASMVQETALKKLVSFSNDVKNVTSTATIKRLQQNQDFAFAGLPVNPSHSFWLEMLENGFPGIKIDLIRKNPLNVQDYVELVKLLNDSGFSLNDTNNLIYSNVSRSITVRIRQMIRW